MLCTSDLINALVARRIAGTDYADAPANDPILLQAARDGYAHRDADKWILHGTIQPGETRILRHSREAGGKVKTIHG